MQDTNNPQYAGAAANGGFSKRSKPQPPLYVPAGHVLFRLLCHSSRIGGVIGKSGSIIKQLQQETAAKIRIEDAPSGTDERVIVVIASNAVNKRITFRASNEGGEVDGAKDEEMEVSAAQEAVVRVFERILDVAAETNGVSVGSVAVVSCRLLAEGFDAGAVIGKGGKVIEKIRNDTGCRLRILGSEKLPACALPNDQIVEIEGDILAVKKALVAVSRCLQDCPPGDRQRRTGSRPFEAIPKETLPHVHGVPPPQRSSVLPPMPANSIAYASGGRPLSMEAERAPTVDPRTQKQDVFFRLLCSNDRVGGVIGKGGTIIRALQNETGASIIVGASIPECDERLVTITAMENFESRYSPAQNAVVLVFNRSVEAALEKGLDSGSNRVSSVAARLLVSSNQVGCLLGKGGTIISEMRKATGTNIRIIGDDQVSKCALENDEVVQITGELGNVQDALYKVAGRLRANFFSSKMLNGIGSRSSPSMTSGLSPYEKARAPPSIGLRASASASQILRHTNLTESMDHLGLTHHYDRPPSPRSFASQTATQVNPRNIVDVARQLTSVKGGTEIGSGSRSAIVTNTTVEIVVPDNIIGSVYGENGGNLNQLRQISGAKVTVHEPHPGTTDRIVVISGTPDETQAAQSLLQAFILTGPS